MTGRARRRISLVALLTLLLWLPVFLAAGSAHAHVTQAPTAFVGARHASPLSRSAQVTQGQVVVEAQSAVPRFPDSVEFALRAKGFETSRAELNYRLVGEPVTAGLQAEVDGVTSDLDLEATLDLSTNYIPPGAEVAYYWTLTGDAGASASTPEQTFTMIDERHEWQNLTDEGKRVSVHWYDGGERFGDVLLETASGALDRLEQAIGAGLERPADVWVYASQDELLDALPANLPEWVGGRAFPELSLVLAAVEPGEWAEDEIKRIVPHELSHLVLYHASRNPYNGPPAWLDEGLAVYNQEVQDPIEEEALEWAATEDRLPPVKALSGSFGADEDMALVSYAQSRSVVEFILNDDRYGPEKLARTIAAFKEGVTYDEALREGLGVTVDELDEQWKASLPYEVNPTGAEFAPSSEGYSFDLDWALLAPAMIVGACAVFFLAGALITLVVLLRRRAMA